MVAQPQPGEFAPTEHLSSEAVAAFADERLPTAARDRALKHLGQCPECMDALQVQRSARYVLRHSGPIRMPGTLAERLAHIAEETPHCRQPSGPAERGQGQPTSGQSAWQRLKSKVFRR